MTVTVLLIIWLLLMCRADEYKALITKTYEEITCAKICPWLKGQQESLEKAAVMDDLDWRSLYYYCWGTHLKLAT